MATGILPAAGKASRFGNVPKFFLPIESPGVTLLDRHVRDLSETCEEVLIGVAPAFAEMLEFRYGDNPLVKVYGLLSESFSSSVIALTEVATSEELVLALPDTVVDHVDYSLLGPVDKDFPLHFGVWGCPENLKGKVGQLAFNQDGGRVTAHADKAPRCDFKFLWGAIKFHRSFTLLMDSNEDSLALALDSCLEVFGSQRGVLFDGAFIDCGTIESYFEALTVVNKGKPWLEKADATK